MSITTMFLVKDPPIERMAMLVEYLRPISSEFVIVDTGSPESAKNRMRGWGTTVVPQHWEDDFSKARNAGLPYCHNDLILILDPDELPSVPMMSHIKWVDNYLESTHINPETMGWLYWTINFWHGVRAVDDDKYWHCRLFRRGHGEFYKQVHEQVALDGQPEHFTRNTRIMASAPRDAYLIHSKDQADIDRSMSIQQRLGEVSM